MPVTKQQPADTNRIIHYRVSVEMGNPRYSHQQMEKDQTKKAIDTTLKTLRERVVVILKRSNLPIKGKRGMVYNREGE